MTCKIFFEATAKFLLGVVLVGLFTCRHFRIFWRMAFYCCAFCSNAFGGNCYDDKKSKASKKPS